VKVKHLTKCCLQNAELIRFLSETALKQLTCYDVYCLEENFEEVNLPAVSCWEVV